MRTAPSPVCWAYRRTSPSGAARSASRPSSRRSSSRSRSSRASGSSPAGSPTTSTTCSRACSDARRSPRACCPRRAPPSPALNDVIAAARRAADLTRQLLAYSGKGRFEVRAIDLSEDVREIAHLLTATLPKNVLLQLELGDRLPAVEADVAQIQQLVLNLVVNGAEAIGDKPGNVLVTTGVAGRRRDERDRSRRSPPPSHRTLRVRRGARHGLRHGRRDEGEDLRPVLHDQVHRSRARARGDAGHRPRSQGRDRDSPAPPGRERASGSSCRPARSLSSAAPVRQPRASPEAAPSSSSTTTGECAEPCGCS